LGHRPDGRERSTEFSTSGIGRDVLLERMDAVLNDARSVLDRLNEADLLRPWKVQGFEEKGVSILVHVVEHYSYHVGQITLLTKLLSGQDTGYYAGLDLDSKG
jgi:uncharacterized damage-inducible protein DinB